MDLKDNLQLKDALNDYLYDVLADFPTEKSLSETMVLSSHFLRRMNRLIRKAKKMEADQAALYTARSALREESREYLPFSPWRRKLVLVIVIITIVASAFTAVAARDQIADFFKTVYEKYTSYVFYMGNNQSETTEVSPAVVITEKLPEYVPEGYVQKDKIEKAFFTHITYINSENNILTFERTKIENFQITMDSEKTAGEDIMIGKMKGFYYPNSGDNNIVWQDSNYVYMIAGKISKDEMIAMAESMYK